jgi:hypothetical protein
MGWKVVTIEQQGQDVIEGWVPEEAVSVEGGKLHPMVFETQACPEVSREVRDFIEKNPHMDLDLHKVVDGKIVARSVEELSQSQWMTWEVNFKTQAEIDAEKEAIRQQEESEALEEERKKLEEQEAEVLEENGKKIAKQLKEGGS